MSWLPAVSIAGNRYWLPLSRPATDVIASLLLRTCPADKERFLRLLRSDPPLAIFATLRYGDAHRRRQRSFGSAGQLSAGSTDLGPLGSDLSPTITLDRVATFGLRRLRGWFAAGDGFLGAPAERDSLVPKWRDVHESFVRLPVSRWMELSTQWLELTGPTLAAARGAAWPSLVDDAMAAMVVRDQDMASRYETSELDLRHLARRLRRASGLEESFTTLLRDAKRAALRQFAYGLSHEINNPLANIVATAEGLRRELQDPAAQKRLQRISDQALRAHEMTADLMFYAHPPVPDRSEVMLQALLDGVLGPFRSVAIQQGIELNCCVAPSDLRLDVDRVMLSEAIRALIRNAIEAIGCDGRIDVRGQVDLGQRSRAVVIEIRDSGPGLSDLARRHAFDPYFSGREAGRGLGVGLCRVERTAQLHGGDVSLTSGPAGCVARLWIPGGS